MTKKCKIGIWCFVILLFLASCGENQHTAQTIVGTWNTIENVQDTDAKVQLTLEFKADGKMYVKVLDFVKEGNYTINEDQLTLTTYQGETESTSTLTFEIKDDTLTTRSQDGIVTIYTKAKNEQ